MDNFLTLESRHTGEILRMRRVRGAGGQIVLVIEGSLPPRMSGPPLHVHFHQREEGTVKAGTLGAQIGREKIVVPKGGAGFFLPESFTSGGAPAMIYWSSTVSQPRRATWIGTFKGCLRFSTRAH